MVKDILELVEKGNSIFNGKEILSSKLTVLKKQQTMSDNLVKEETVDEDGHQCHYNQD